MNTSVEVLCGGLSSPVAREGKVLRLSLAGRGQNITLRHDISQRLATNIPPVIADLVEVATYVHCADHATTRGGNGVLNYGSRWRRTFRFHIPVREPAIWSSPQVLSALERTLSFLSDDDYRFSFTLNARPAPIQRYFLSKTNENVEPEFDCVVLFSGGLDSLGGAIRRLIQDQKRTVLVTHRSSRKVEPHVRHLVKLLRGKPQSAPLLHLPVRIEKSRRLSREFTQRTRSFLYASLAAATAQALGLDAIEFYENGIVSFNLPLAAQVIGARATRTTHPDVLSGFAELFSLLLGRPFAVENPFLWMTKADVLTVIASHGCADLIRYSNSCTRTFERTRLHSHCGICSQCIDRRIAIMGAGLESYDPEEMYKLNLLTDAREPGEARTMAECYIRFATEVGSMSEAAFLARFGEVSRIVNALPGKADDNARRVYELHRKHAECVARVIDGAMAKHSKEMRQGTLPDTSLIVLSLHGRYRAAAEGALRLRTTPSQGKGVGQADKSSRRRARELAAKLRSIPPGRDSAAQYHSLMFEIIRVLFSPWLAKPTKEKPVNEGRQRIDIVCRNTTKQSFFSDLRSVFQIYCPFIIFECKNYNADPENPEFDQLSGRLGREGSGRGQFGILICRVIEDKAKVMMHCKDRLKHKGEYIVAIDDQQIHDLLKMRSGGRLVEMYEFLHGLFAPLFD